MKRISLYSLVLSFFLTMVLTASTALQATKADDAIESAFEKSYNYKTYLRKDNIKIETKGGITTLSGTVSGETHKTLAEQTAANIPGVKSVENRLETKAEVAAENSDKWIERKIMLALLFHRNVNAKKTSVEAKDGIVTLKGEALSEAQKELTTEYAKDIEGVKEVKNVMTIAPNSKSKATPAVIKMDDASITAQVKTALLTHQSTSAIQTEVHTLNGTVTITGIAKNESEKSLVTKLADDINGVVKVKNEMTVAEVKK